MKTTRSNTKQSKQGISNKPRPEERDNLDSHKRSMSPDDRKKKSDK